MVYYRKYRPQSLPELVGQSAIQTTLQKAFESQKLSHAYLFCGPRGTGKTSTARILAKMINCEKNPSTNNQSSATTIPCNDCSICLSITDGSNLDVIEIDAASNRGIDDMRELRERVKLSPSSATKKVYIIDEVHMLTTEAFNALLKTLEEPPAHVVFILATTDPQKIPQTILSRVQRLNFQLAAPEDLLQALAKVVAGENLTISPEALNLIVKKAEGSFRDALKLLDQLASTGEEITERSVESQLRSGRFETIIEMLQILSQSDANKALITIGKHLEGGVSVKDYTLMLMDTLRSLLFIKQNASVTIRAEVGEEKFNHLLSLSQKFTVPQLLSILNCLQSSVEKLKYTFIPSLPLEIALVECCLQHAPTATVATAQPVIESNESNLVTVNSLVDDHVLGMDDIMALKEKWTYVLETIKPFNYSLEALLRSIKLVKSEADKIFIEVPYSFHQRILETPRNRDMLESVFSDILSKPVRIACILGTRPVRVEEISNIEVAADDEVIRLAAEIFNSDSAS